MSLLLDQIKSYHKLKAKCSIQYENSHVPDALIIGYDDEFIMLQYNIFGSTYICSTRISLIVGILLLNNIEAKCEKPDYKKQFEGEINEE